jgi:hypothetical protein
MKAYFRYFKYILVHKYFVFLAGLKIKAPFWLLLIHDWSKLLPSEFFPYADYFYNKWKRDKENIKAFGLFKIAEAAPFGYYTKDRFNMAWLFHQRRNKHHWQYWFLIQDEDSSFPLPMPDKYAREMVADWAGAGRAITGHWGVGAWYEKNNERIKLHPDTRLFVESLLRNLNQIIYLA